MSRHATVKDLLKRCHLIVKIAYMSLVACAFFLFVFFVPQRTMVVFYALILVAVVMQGVVTYVVIGSAAFWLTLRLWVIGTVIYLAIAIPLTLNGVEPTPWIRLDDTTQRLLYSVLYPVRILGIFFVGLVFLSITSPTEFFIFGRVGLYVALLLRSIEVSKLNVVQTLESFKILGMWPDRVHSIGRTKALSMRVRSCPLIIIVTLRNLANWMPWAWVHFKRLEERFKEVCT